MMNKERIEYLDLIKFIAIYFVPFLHLITYGIVSDPISWEVHDFMYSFHMPLFAIVSGYFYSIKQNFFSFVFKKIKFLMIPLLIWGIVSVLVSRLPYDIQDKQFHVSSYFRDYISAVFTQGWFLKALLCCFIYAASFQLLLKKYNQLIVLFASLVLLLMVSLAGIIPNKSCLEGFIFLYPFFVVGVFWKKSSLFNKIQNRILPFALVVFIILYFTVWDHSFCFYTANTAFCNNNPSGYSGIYLVFVLLCRFFMGCTGSFACLKIIKKIYPVLKEKKYVSGFIDKCCTIGRNTITIYLSQDIILPLFRGSLVEVNIIVSFICAVAIAFFYCYLFSVIKERFPSKLF